MLEIERWDGKVYGCDQRHGGGCYGEIWICIMCWRTQCWNDGAEDDLPDLCDECWCKAEKEGGKGESGQQEETA